MSIMKDSNEYATEQLDQINAFKARIEELRSNLPKYVLFFLDYVDHDVANICDRQFDITEEVFWRNRVLNEHVLLDLRVGDFIYCDRDTSVIVRVK